MITAFLRSVGGCSRPRVMSLAVGQSISPSGRHHNTSRQRRQFCHHDRSRPHQRLRSRHLAIPQGKLAEQSVLPSFGVGGVRPGCDQRAGQDGPGEREDESPQVEDLHVSLRTGKVKGQFVGLSRKLLCTAFGCVVDAPRRGGRPLRGASPGGCVGGELSAGAGLPGAGAGVVGSVRV
jgi:hypothetical protein